MIQALRNKKNALIFAGEKGGFKLHKFGWVKRGPSASTIASAIWPVWVLMDLGESKVKR